MDGRLLKEKGFTMLETAAVMLVIFYILSMIIPDSRNRIQAAKFQKTILEMKTIASASVDFYMSQGVCPSLNQLAPIYIPQAVVSSPFSSPYQINCGGNLISVSNLIPSGIEKQDPQGPLLQVAPLSGQDNVTISLRVPYSFTGRLLYDKKYLYGGS